MLRIIDCLTVDHDYSIVLLAAILCLLGSFSTVVVGGRAMLSLRRTLWIALSSICFGATAWSTHFIAMLAYKTSLPITFDLELTILSLLTGIGIMGIGFTVAIVQKESFVLRCLGGALIGTGVIVLHYVGMSGLQFPGVMHYDTDLVVVSLLASIMFGCAAAATIFNPQRQSGAIVGAVLLVLMTVTLHFIGMAAVVLELDTLGASEPQGISHHSLLIAVTLASAMVLLIGTGAALIDQQVGRHLATQAERFKTLADGAFEGLIVHQNHKLVDANVAARKLLNLDALNYIGHDISDWGLPVCEYLEDDAEVVGELELKTPDGTVFPAEICRRRIRLGDGNWGELIAIRDQTARRLQDEHIAYLAQHDPLTDLPNRGLCNELAASILQDSKHSGSAFALFAIDLDNFKYVNDTHGHSSGDVSIRTVALRLSDCLDENDFVARIGGDEFALIQTSIESAVDASTLAMQIQAVLQKPITINGVDVLFNASIGIAMYPDDGEEMEILLCNANTAMYQAKANGKGTFRFFENQMNAEVETRGQLENRLRGALADNALTVYYQPLIASKDGRMCCFEALIRWTDKELGPVSPMDFIPIAESTGMIVRIGEFVLRKACRDAVTWPDSISVAVNLSVVQFENENLVTTVKQALLDSGLPGERLELEITESLLIDDPENVVNILNELKSLGIKIAMDDFGTGYSSLSYLQSFAFNKLKIDRSFVSNLEESSQGASIVQAVVSMSKSLQMTVVAEGVETLAQLEMLREFQCDELQGYLIAKPMPAGQVLAFILSAESETRRLKIA